MLKERAGWLDEPPVNSPVVRLLPRFDTYLLGYRTRDLPVAPEHVSRILPGGALIHSVIIAGGRAVGTWKNAKKRDSLDVVVEPFDVLVPDLLPGLEEEVDDVGRFLGMPASMRVVAPT
jgi:hypothetical protein